MNSKSRKTINAPCLTQAEIIDQLKQAGVNPTAQRIAICKFVLCDADHPTADEVKAWADSNFPKMSLATVYNTLNLLVEAKLLREYKFSHSQKIIYDNNMDKHYHFYDEENGKVTDLMLDQVDVRAKLSRGFKISDIDVIVRGTKR
jgi:Fur family iron response transcriptional regulator